MYEMFFHSDWNDLNNPVTSFKDFIDNDKKIESSLSENVLWNRKDINYGITVRILGNEYLINKVKSEDKITDGYMSILKSNLQKQIRRGKLESVTTAAMMWQADKSQLLRRLVIIAFEDVVPSFELMTIVWLMCVYSKGYELCDHHKEWVLKYVKALTLEQNCIFLNLNISDRKRENFYINEISYMENSNQREFMMCMLFRVSYGGTKGDMEMIKAVLYNHRIRQRKKFGQLKNKISDITIYPLLPYKILLNAIDFHCYPQILKIIQNYYYTPKDNIIRETLWFASSSINYRKEFGIEEIYIKTWNKINKLFFAETEKYLIKIHQENKDFVKKWYKKTHGEIYTQ